MPSATGGQVFEGVGFAGLLSDFAGAVLASLGLLSPPELGVLESFLAPAL